MRRRLRWVPVQEGVGLARGSSHPGRSRCWGHRTCSHAGRGLGGLWRWQACGGADRPRGGGRKFRLHHEGSADPGIRGSESDGADGARRVVPGTREALRTVSSRRGPCRAPRSLLIAAGVLMFTPPRKVQEIRAVAGRGPTRAVRGDGCPVCRGSSRVRAVHAL